MSDNGKRKKRRERARQRRQEMAGPKKVKGKEAAIPPGLLRLFKPPRMPGDPGRPLPSAPPPPPRMVGVVLLPNMKRGNGGEKRECGECTACCTVLGAKALGKPYYVTCEHVCDKGCGIYADRPRECVEYECTYRHGGLPPDVKYRPDNLGVLMNVERDPSMLARCGIEWWISIYETRAGAAGEIDPDKCFSMRDDLLDICFGIMEGYPHVNGVRIFKHNQRVGTLYAFRPPYPDEGESSGGRWFRGLLPASSKIQFMVLDAPLRQRTIPLPMVDPPKE